MTYARVHLGIPLFHWKYNKILHENENLSQGQATQLCNSFSSTTSNRKFNVAMKFGQDSCNSDHIAVTDVRRDFSCRCDFFIWYIFT